MGKMFIIRCPGVMHSQFNFMVPLTKSYDRSIKSVKPRMYGAQSLVVQIHKNTLEVLGKEPIFNFLQCL